MSNPAFGQWGDPEAWGEEAPGPRQEMPGAIMPEPSLRQDRCPLCAVPVRWETDGNGEALPVEGGRVHLCEPDEALRYVADREDGAEILALMRRVLNERRMYGAAV